jgi:hypothetical protein
VRTARTITLLAGALLSAAWPAAAQDRLITIGAGVASDSTGRAYSFALSFNRTESADAEPGAALWTHAVGRSLWTLIPSAEANIGSGVDVASNNVLVEIALADWISAGRGQWRVSLAPTVTADKNFQTGLYYARLGAERVWYNNPDYPRVFAALRLDMDGGRRTSDALAGTTFWRAVPHASLTIANRSGFELIAAARVWNIRGDTTVISNGSRVFVRTELTYRFPDWAQPGGAEADPYAEPEHGPLGLTIGYVYGYDEPLFARQHALTIGLSLYRN